MGRGRGGGARGGRWSKLFWRVVDVDVDGPVITFSVDRKLLDDLTDLHFRVFAITLRNEFAGDEIDHYPEEGEPPAVYTLSEEWD